VAYNPQYDSTTKDIFMTVKYNLTGFQDICRPAALNNYLYAIIDEDGNMRS
jgi:hypothetical protein